MERLEVGRLPPTGRPYVGVIGPGAGAATAGDEDLAREVGGLLARHGVVVVCGGLGGVMEAACEGARREGGETVGLLPGDRRDDGNRYLTLALPTGLGELRNGLVVRASDALVCVGRSWGTLSELALGLQSGRTVTLLHSWRREEICGLAEVAPADLVHEARTPEEAVARIVGSDPPRADHPTLP